MFVYCKKCGLIQSTKNESEICKACDILMAIVPKEYLSKSGFMFVSQEKRDEFENWIKSGEEYDEVANLERDVIIKEKNIEHELEVAKKVDEYNQNRVKFQCPICHSESLEKISNVGKVVKVGVFGILGAGDIGKKYRCKSCGYRF